MFEEETLTQVKTKKPSLYKVILYNDDYTPMDFVVAILKQIFNKSLEDATAIMLDVHQNGKGICGVYTFEVAETKMLQVEQLSSQEEHPLQCGIEEQ